MKKGILAAGLLTMSLFATQAMAHSGGCKKSSPAGQCCHSGSKPYHCH